VPDLNVRHRRRQRVKRLAFELPWTAAVLPMLETTKYAHRCAPHGALDDAWIARQLGAEVHQVTEAIEALADAEVVARRDGKWEVVGSLTVDVRATPADVLQFKRHWLGAAHEQLSLTDSTSINLFAVSNADLEKIRELQKSTFREIRAIVASSSRSDAAAMMVFHLAEWTDTGG